MLAPAAARRALGDGRPSARARAPAAAVAGARRHRGRTLVERGGRRLPALRRGRRLRAGAGSRAAARWWWRGRSPTRAVSCASSASRSRPSRCSPRSWSRSCCAAPRSALLADPGAAVPFAGRLRLAAAPRPAVGGRRRLGGAGHRARAPRRTRRARPRRAARPARGRRAARHLPAGVAPRDSRAARRPRSAWPPRSHRAHLGIASAAARSS